MAVRTESVDQYVSLSFDCGSQGTWFQRTDAYGMNNIRHDLYTGTAGKTSMGTLEVPLGSNLLAVNLKGTLIARTGMLGRLTLIPPQSLVYVRNARLLVQAARGEHETIVLSWSGRNTLMLEEWMTGRHAPKNEKGESRTLGVKPINPHFLGAIDRLKQTTARESAVTELEVFSVIYECVGKLMTGSDEMQLASLPVNMPESMSELIASVRENPAGSWPLREASDRAGYSPFHFSRIFKSIVGYGFHEFVDRCRTESAVKMLLVSELSVDSIAQKCGFGTTQGLRESVKEYLGLVPSELRSLPEIPGSSLLR